MMIQKTMQFIHQGLLSAAGRIIGGRLRAALVLCAMAVVPLAKAQVVEQRGAVYTGDTMLWKCQEVNEPGTYYHGVTHTLLFRTIDTTHVYESETICGGETLLWRCKQLSESGQYNDTLHSLEYPELDSIYYTINLTVLPTTVLDWVTIYVHQDQLPYDWDGTSCPAPGEYMRWSHYDPLPYQDALGLDGCNKVQERIRIILRDTVDMTACEGDTILWRCTPAYETKVYGEEVTSVGALSGEVITTELHYLNMTYQKRDTAAWETVYVHADQLPLTWNDETCPAPGEYTHWLPYSKTPYQIANNLEACDSILLRVRVVLRDTVDMTACEGDTILWRCTPAYETKVYGEEVTSVGALSGEVITTELHYLNMTYQKRDTAAWETVYVHADQLPLTWNDETCPAPGEYTHWLPYSKTPYQIANNLEACDSILLRVRVVLRDTVDMTACEGDTILWRCTPAYETKVYGEDVTSVGALSGEVITTELHYLNMTYQKRDTAAWETVYVHADQLPLTWNDETCPAPGEYTHWLPYSKTPYQIANNLEACDSILLRVRVVLRDTVDMTACEGDTILWRCTPAYETKVYGEEVTSVGTLSGEVITTELHYLNMTYQKRDTAAWETVYVHADQLPLTWNDETCPAPGEYTHWLPYSKTPYQIANNLEACDSILLRVRVVLRDTVDMTACEGDTILWRCTPAYETKVYGEEVTSVGTLSGEVITTELHYLNMTYQKRDTAAWETVYVHADQLPLTWNDETCPAPGEYTHWLPYSKTPYQIANNLEACDSILLRVRVVLRDTVDMTACEGDTILWRCTPAYETKVYGEEVTSVGALSGEVITTELHYLNMTYQKRDTAAWETVYVHADQLPLTWNDETCPAPGEYTHWLPYSKTPYQIANNLEACDSILLRVRVVLRDTVDMTACEGDTILWRCTPAYETKVYGEEVTSVGALSGEVITTELHYLNFTYQTKEVADWDTIYVKKADFPYQWQGEDCNKPGEYAKWLQYEKTQYQIDNGLEACDSILLRVRIVQRDTVEDFICNGDTLLWRCTQAGETKMYMDEPVTAIGDISGEETITELYYLDFTYYAAPKDSVKDEIVTYSPYLWRGRELTENGTYRDTTYYNDDPTGCIDSLFTLNLKLEVAIDIETSDTICSCDSALLWRCIRADTTGTYRDTVFFESGNDSIRYTLHLQVNTDSVAPLEQVILCNGDSLLWYDKETGEKTRWLKTPGLYRDTTHYAPTLYQQSMGLEGCDSVAHELLLVIRPVRDTIYASDTICYDAENPVYPWKTWHDTIFKIPTTDTESKWYTFTDTVRYVFPSDCDSVRYTKKVWVRRTENRYFVTKDSVCADGGVVPTEYSWTIAADGGREKLVTLTADERTRTGKFIVTRYDTVRYTPTSKGYRCDSAYYELNLYIFRPQLNQNDKTKLDTLVTDTTLCSTDQLEWYGTTYSVTDINTYPRTVTDLHTLYYDNTECDSVTCRLQLHFRKESDTIQLPIMLCKGAEEQKAGPHDIPITSDESRVYWDSIYYENTQCIEHYYKIDVTVLTPQDSVSTAVVCHGDPFTWDLTGEVLKDTGWYVHKVPYQRLGGCDSLIYRLHLTDIELDSMPVETAYICHGESYTWRGTTYKETGIYRDTVKSVGGCDSMCYILSLEMRPPKGIRRDTAYICGTSGEYIWPFNGKTYTRSGEYEDTTWVHGCIDTAAILLVRLQPMILADVETATIYSSQSYLWDKSGLEYSTPGTHEWIDKYASGCDSIKYTLELIVKDIEFHYAEDVKEIVCPGTTYVEHEREHVINAYSEFADTTRVEENDLIYDLITRYYIDVYDTSLPQNFLKFAYASCGAPISIDSAAHILDTYINDNPKYAQVASTTWEFREGTGEWQPIEEANKLTGRLDSVDVRCTVETECGTQTERTSLPVMNHATPENFTLYDRLPIVTKYNGTLLMIDLNWILERFDWKDGVDIHPEDVRWYRIEGKMDNLTYPDQTDPNDVFMNKWGYYYTPQDSKDYYALIDGTLPAEVDDCGVWARTLPIEGSSPIQLQPNVVQPNAVVTIAKITDCTVTIHDMYGNIVLDKYHSSGTFKAPNTSGTYYVTIDDGTTTYYRTLIVYP